MMEFKKATHVYTADNQNIGRIERVVLNPVTRKVTHVVIRQGLFFTEDKVIPVEYFSEATEERATLRSDVGDLHKLPKFEEVEHVPVESHELKGFPGEVEEAPFYLYWYPPLGGDSFYETGYYGLAGLMSDFTLGQSRYVRHTKHNIPENTVALEEGAKVHSSDHQYVGNIEEIQVDPATDYATHMLISKGAFLKETKWIPTLWLKTVAEDNVYLAVTAATIEHLPTAEII
jgi:uncharacterized protein YrrD